MRISAIAIAAAAMSYGYGAVFAKATEAGSSAPPPPPAAKSPEVPAPIQAANGFTIRANVRMPEQKAGVGRGGQSKYPFDALPAPMLNPDGTVLFQYSFGLKDKDAKKIGSTVTSANNRYREQLKNDDGSLRTKVVTKKGVPRNVPDYVFDRQFKAVNVDPATDEDGATVRIFRVK